LNDQINGGNLNGSIQPASILSLDVAKFVFGRRPSSPPGHHSPVYREAASHFAFRWGTTPSVVPTTTGLEAACHFYGGLAYACQLDKKKRYYEILSGIFKLKLILSIHIAKPCDDDGHDGSSKNIEDGNY